MKIMHPDLPKGQWADVQEEAMYHLAAAGWVPVPDDMLEEKAAADEADRAATEAAMAPPPEEATAEAPAEAVVVPETAEGTGAAVVPGEEEDED